MDKFFIILQVLIAYLPFQLALNLAPDVDLLSGRALIPVFFVAWLAASLYWRDRGLKLAFNSPVSWALLLFFILAAASILVADNYAWGLRKLLVFASVFPLFWLTSSLVKKEKERSTLVFIIIGGAAISALVALGQFLAQFVWGQEALINFWASRVVPLFSGASFGALVVANPSWQVNVAGQTLTRAIGLFPDPHTLAFYLGLTSPFALAQFFFGKKYRWTSFVVYGLLVIVLLLTFSRGGYLAWLAASIIFARLAWSRFCAPAKKFLAAGVLLAVIVLLVAGWPIAERLFSSFNLGEGSNVGRLAIWRDSWEVIKKNPFLGVGLGNYPAAVDFSGAYRSAITSHDLYLDLWVETGVLGLVTWLFLIWSAASDAYRRLDREPATSLASLAALVYFSVHAFFETPVFNPTVLAFLMVVLALVSAENKENVL